MEGQLYLVYCQKEENQEYNDEFDICLEIYNLFYDNKNLKKLKIYVLDDDYVDFLNSTGSVDCDAARVQYVSFHSRVDYEQQFLNSPFSEIIDSAILPALFIKNDKTPMSFEFRITDDKKKILTEYIESIINNSVANSILQEFTDKRKVCINSFLLKLDKQIFDYETELIEEIVDAQNYGITKKYKKLRFNGADVIVTFIYVIAISKIPMIISRDYAEGLKKKSSDVIVNYNFDNKKIEEILSTDKTYNMKVYIINNFLIYPEEIDEFYEELETYLNKGLK